MAPVAQRTRIAWGASGRGGKRLRGRSLRIRPPERAARGQPQSDQREEAIYKWLMRK
jgi:hypothetical protein